MPVDTSRLYPDPPGKAAALASPFFSLVPTDQILALAAERRLRRADAMLLLALLAHKRRPAQTEVRPAQERLAALLACSVRTVQRGLGRLEDAGLLARRRRRDTLGRLRGLCYDLARLLRLLPAPKAAPKTPPVPRAALRPVPHTTRVSCGRPAPPAAAPSADGPPAPATRRQGCRPGLDSDAVGIENNSGPAPGAPPEAPPPGAAAGPAVAVAAVVGEAVVGEGIVGEAVVGEMVALGVWRRAAAALLARCGPARCRQALDALGRRRGVTDPPAWLVRCLSEGWDVGAPAGPASAGRPRAHHPYTPPAPAAVAAGGGADPLERLSPGARAALEHAARAALVAEMPALRPILEKNRHTPTLRGRMRGLLQSGWTPPAPGPLRPGPAGAAAPGAARGCGPSRAGTG